MKITDIKTSVVKGNFGWILVKVFTDEGLGGLGESYWGAGVEDSIKSLKHVLLGEDPHNIDWLYQKMVRAMSGSGSTGGTSITAISGVELALWDIKGKALQTPIYNLLGGRYRDRIRIYADCGQNNEPTPEAWADKARAAVAKGFTAIKFDIDNLMPEEFGPRYHVAVNSNNGWMQGQQIPISNDEMDLMIRLVGAVREAIGTSIDLAIDCHWNYSTRDAIKLAQELAPFRLMWLEDPVPPDNIDALKRVTDNSPIPICSGENHYTRHGFRTMITTQAVDIVQPDIPKAGGLLEAKKIADLADIYYLPMAAHNVSSPVATMAACHVLSGIRNFASLEFHAQDIPWWDDLIIGQHPLIRDGYIQLPDMPGLGIDLDESMVRTHLDERSSFFD